VTVLSKGKVNVKLSLCFSSSLTEHPLVRRLGRSQSQSGHGGEEKNFPSVLGLEPLIIQPRTVSECCKEHIAAQCVESNFITF
jgi:hypothetical protein